MRRSIAFIVAVCLLALLMPSCGGLPVQSSDSPYRAAIIDQLHVLEPNPGYIAQVTELLESYGFGVDVWQGEEITVDFYRELPKLEYKLILFRVHSGILLALEGSKVTPSQVTYLFTAESYSTTRHVSDQLTDRVANALMNDKYPLVFAINSDFIINDLKGDFDNTAVIVMGCESQYLDDMAEAFVTKGASLYVGWSTIVSLEHVDKAAVDLLTNLCVEDLTVADSIAKTMGTVGNDPYFKAYLKHYPVDKGDLTIKELVN